MHLHRPVITAVAPNLFAQKPLIYLRPPAATANLYAYYYYALMQQLAHQMYRNIAI